MKAEDDKLVEIFSGELWKATMIRNMLVENGIEAEIQNELQSVIQPWVLSPGGVDPAKVVILQSDYDVAVRLVEEYNSSPGNEL